MVYTKLSWPSKSGSGVYSNVPSGFNDAAPLLGWLLPVAVRVSPFGSESFSNTSIVTGVSSSVEAALLTATGGSLLNELTNNVTEYGRKRQGWIRSEKKGRDAII